MLAPIILAAGRSSRMGSPKELLFDCDGRSFVARIVRTFAEAGFDEVTVVTGGSHDGVQAALKRDRPPAAVKLARNPDPDRGQLSSIWTGMDAAVTADTAAIVLTVVDVPYVSSATIKLIVEAYTASGALIVRPAIGDEHGHPVILDRALFSELRRTDPAMGAKAVLRAHDSQILNVPVSDRGALFDLDTRADYEATLQGFIPDKSGTSILQRQDR